MNLHSRVTQRNDHLNTYFSIGKSEFGVPPPSAPSSAPSSLASSHLSPAAAATSVATPSVDDVIVDENENLQVSCML